MKFGDLHVTPYGKEDWKLLKDMDVYLTPEFDYQPVVIPSGRITDLASIRPRFLIGYLRKETRKAAVLHDEGCKYGVLQTLRGGLPIPISRRTADKMFYYGLRSEGVGKMKATVMWMAVRAFGVFK